MIEVRMLAASEAARAGELAALINRVYEVAEEGLWQDGAMRTTPAEMVTLIKAGEIAAAFADGRLAGSVRVRDVADDTSEFGILVSAPDERSTGVGRALLDFIEEQSRDRGLRAMRLEVLVPREWTHPTKEFVRGWYDRRGYRLTRVTTMDESYAYLAPLLATACDLEVYEKPLR